MPKYALVEEAAKHCWSKNFMGKRDCCGSKTNFTYFIVFPFFPLEPFRQFYAKNADLFYDAPQAISGEQNMQYYSLYQEYLKLYEENLSSYIESLDISITEFYRELAEIRNDPEIKDKKLLHFVDYLVACTDYESFYKVMQRAAKKLRAADQADNVAESKSGGGEGKSSGGYDNDSKSPSRGGGAKDYK
jgi:hypothetical protein